MVLSTGNPSNDNRQPVFILDYCLSIWGKTDWINYLFPWNDFHIKHVSVFKEPIKVNEFWLCCHVCSTLHFWFYVICLLIDLLLSMDNLLLRISIYMSFSIKTLFINWCLSDETFFINWCIFVEAFFINWWLWQFLCILVY